MVDSPRTRFILPVAGMGLLLTACSEGGNGAVEAPVRESTKANAPDPCTLISAAVVADTVGARTGKKTSTAGSVGCQWEVDTPVKPSDRAGLLTLNTYVQRQYTVGKDKYHDAKVGYRGFQAGRPCKVVSSAAEESCWYSVDKGLSIVLRRGYIVVSITAAAVNSPALAPNHLEATSQKLISNVLQNLES